MSTEHHRPDGTANGCTSSSCVAATGRGDRWLGRYLSVSPDGRVHVHHRDELHVTVRSNRAAAFHKLCERYDADPTDLSVAWEFLRTHPIFHRPTYTHGTTRSAADLEPDELAAPVYVEEEDGLRELWTWLTRDGESTVVRLEHGPHLWPGDVPVEHRVHYPADGMSSHDPRLDTVASTYEAAIVALAAAVRSCYGVDRSRVDTRW